MADETNNTIDLDDPQFEENPSIRQVRDHAKNLERELREQRQFREAVEPQLRSYALKEAGIDPDAPIAQALLKVHEGPWEPSEVRKTIEQYGFPTGDAAPQSSQPQLTDEQQHQVAATQRDQQLAAGAQPPATPQSMPERIKAEEARAVETGDWTEFNRLQSQALDALG